MAAIEVCSGRDRAMARLDSTSSFFLRRDCSHVARSRPVARPRRYFWMRFQA
jgi:hypothetical protein